MKTTRELIDDVRVLIKAPPDRVNVGGVVRGIWAVVERLAESEYAEPITCCDDPKHWTWVPDKGEGTWQAPASLCYSAAREKGFGSLSTEERVNLRNEPIHVTCCCHRALLADGQMTGPLVDVMSFADRYVMGAPEDPVQDLVDRTWGCKGEQA